MTNPQRSTMSPTASQTCRYLDHRPLARWPLPRLSPTGPPYDTPHRHRIGPLALDDPSLLGHAHRRVLLVHGRADQHGHPGLTARQNFGSRRLATRGRVLEIAPLVHHPWLPSAQLGQCDAQPRPRKRHCGDRPHRHLRRCAHSARPRQTPCAV